MASVLQLVIARVNPQTPGSVAEGLPPAAIAQAIWLSAEALMTLGHQAGDTVIVRTFEPGSSESSSPRSVSARVVAAPAGTLPPGLALMASSPHSAELLADDTASSGTPTSKGLAITLEPASADPRSPTSAKTAPAPTAPRPAASVAASLRVIDDAVCTACGCICDDIRLSVAADESSIQQAENACEIGRAWFTETLVETDSTRSSASAAWIEGRPAGVDAALDRAVEILLRARNPLVYGLSETSCEAQRVAVELADLLRANLDTTTSTFHGPTVMALQAVGESTCTLGEIRDRADLVMLWGVNPLETDPRHYTRYSLMPAGRFVPRGRVDRYCFVVDVRPTPTAGLADHALLIKPASDFEALATLRALAAGIEPDAEAVVVATGIELAEWREVFKRMRAARYGVILYGTGVTQTRGKHLNCEALLSLVSEMNRHTRFACKAMRGPGNVTGGDNVLTWRTGYPFGVNFARGFPRYNPGEYTAADLLARREVDAALIISSDPAPFFGPAALAHLAVIPTVVIDARATAARQQATVGLASAFSGLQSGGTVYRMDEIPLTLRPALPADRPSEVEWLENLVAKIQARLGDADCNSSDPTAVRGGA